MASNSVSPDSLPMERMQISEPIQFYQSKKGPVDMISCQLTAPPGLSNPRSILYEAKSNSLFIVDSDNKRVLVLTMDWQLVCMFGEGEFESPWGVAVLADSVFVTDVGNHGLLKFSLSDFCLVSKVSSTDNKKLKEPRGIAADGKELFVADSGSHTISVFSSDLEFLKYIGSGNLWFPRDVGLAQDSILTLDKSDFCMHLFSKDGEMKSSIIPLDPKRKSSPLFFSIDNSGNIIISDYEAKSIRVFDLTGNSIHTIEVSECPKGVIVVQDKLICCYANSIQIF